MDIVDKMKSGEVYYPTDPELEAKQRECLEILYDYNITCTEETEKREEILKKLLGDVGIGCHLEPPFHANWGKHTHMGDYVYANSNLTLVDDTDIFIGNNVSFEANVTVATAGHPIHPELRRKAAQFNIPVKIGNNVWIGADSVILPGVTIGDNTVIGAGSIVTKDIPANVVAAGNPCRVMREISDRDMEFCFENMDVVDKKKSGEGYYPTDSKLEAKQCECFEMLCDYNMTRPGEIEKREEILKKLLGDVGKGCYLEPPFHAHWGKHTHMGDYVYANFNLTLVDDNDIFIGNNVMFAPNVTVATAKHPIHPWFRRKATQLSIPVRIGNNVWIGANSVILPGVTIGDNTVIGAGSVVTKDIPANVVAVGNPCRVMRQISERDLQYYFKNKKIDFENL